MRSVKLFSRVPFGRIERLALDAGSRTSQALVRVWLDAAHGVRPARIEPLPMGVPAQESTADAVLRDRRPGDEGPRRAVPRRRRPGRGVGGADRPAVRLRALGGPRRASTSATLPEVLARCRAEGLAHADELAAEHGPRLGLDVATCYDYLTQVAVLRPGRARDRRPPPVRPDGRRRWAWPRKESDLVFHRRRDLAARR